MQEVENVDIDISDIIKYYQAHDVGLGADDIQLIEEVFKMFQDKIKEAMQ